MVCDFGLVAPRKNAERVRVRGPLELERGLDERFQSSPCARADVSAALHVENVRTREAEGFRSVVLSPPKEGPQGLPINRVIMVDH